MGRRCGLGQSQAALTMGLPGMANRAMWPICGFSHKHKTFAPDAWLIKIDDVGPNKPPEKEPPKYPINIQPEQVFQSWKQGKKLTVVDAREDHERELYGTITLPQAMKNVEIIEVDLIDLSYGFDGWMFDDKGMIVCMCSSGLRSGRVAQYLREGEIDAQRVIGGIPAWN